MEMGALFMDEDRSISSNDLSFDLSHHPFDCEPIYIENIPKEPMIKIEESSVYSSDVSTQPILPGFTNNELSTNCDGHRDLVKSMGGMILVSFVIMKCTTNC
jgi:hypothetical protein